eukprot:scaffold1790_cov130-Isochrysis_galbana.AAC.1
MNFYTESLLFLCGKSSEKYTWCMAQIVGQGDNGKTTRAQQQDARSSPSECFLPQYVGFTSVGGQPAEASEAEAGARQQ